MFKEEFKSRDTLTLQRGSWSIINQSYRFIILKNLVLGLQNDNLILAK